MKIYSIIFFFILSNINDVESTEVEVWPRSAKVFSSNSVKLILRSAELQSFGSCTIFTPNDDRFYVDESIFNNTVIQIQENAPDCLQWIDLKTCSVIISNVSEYSHGYWKLSADIYTSSTIIFIISLPSSNSTITTTLGSSVYIDCTLKNELKPEYCNIVNSQGETVSDICLLNINPVKLEHKGIWKCKIGLAGSIDQIVHEVNVEIKPDEYVIGTLRKVENFIEMKCVLKDSIFMVKWCRALTPNGEYLTLSEGLVKDKYSSFGTNFEEKTCGIEIQLPLDTNIDIGRWRIDLGGNIQDYTGCFFNVPDNNDIILPVPDNNEKKESIEIGESLLFQCSVPWPIKYCYVQNPNGEFLYSTSNAATRLHKVGVCQIIVNNMTLDGRWTCGVSSQNDTEDLQFYTYVDILHSELKIEIGDAEITVDEPLNLICKSQLGKSIRYCRFTSPINKGYSVQPTYVEAGNYRSPSLENGVCILHIEKLQMENYGTWTCAASLASTPTHEEYATIDVNLSKPEQSLAAIIGIASAAVIVFVGVSIFFFYRFKKRRTENTISTMNSNE